MYDGDERALPEGRTWPEALADLKRRITTLEELELEHALTEAEWRAAPRSRRSGIPTPGPRRSRPMGR